MLSSDGCFRCGDNRKDIVCNTCCIAQYCSIWCLKCDTNNHQKVCRYLSLIRRVGNIARTNYYNGTYNALLVGEENGTCIAYPAKYGNLWENNMFMIIIVDGNHPNKDNIYTVQLLQQNRSSKEHLI